MDDNDKSITKKSTETKNHKIVNKSKDLWREKERRRLLDQTKIEEFERAEKRARLRAFPKTFIVFFFIPISTIVVIFYIISTDSFLIDVSIYDNYNTDYSTIKPAIKMLRNGTTEEKLEAIDFLGSYMDSDAIEPLIKAYPDEDESVNIAILETLAGPWDRSYIEPLTKAMSHKDSSIRRSAIVSLGKRSDHRVVPILFEALSDKDKKVSELAFLALTDDNGKMNVDLLFPILKKALYDKDERARESTARAFSYPTFFLTEEIEYFLPALKDSNSNVRKYMIKAFNHFDHDPETFNLILYIFLNDEVVSVRIEAARALSAFSITDHKALDDLIPVVLDDIEDPEVIRAALYSIIVISKRYVTRSKDEVLFETREDIVIDLAKKLKEGKYNYRHPLYVKAANDAMFTGFSSEIHNVIIFLKELDHPDAVPVLIAMFEREPSSFTKRIIIEVLGGFGDPWAIKTLISALDDPDDEIRESALLSLEKITGQNFDEDQNKWRSWLKENNQTVPLENNSIN